MDTHEPHTFRLPADAARWSAALGDLCRAARDGDTPVVPTAAMGELARRALDRLGKAGVAVQVEDPPESAGAL